MEVHGSIDGQRNLVSDQRKETDFLLEVGMRVGAANAQRTEPALAPGERKDTSRGDTQFIEEFPMLGKPRLRLPVCRYESLLRFMYPCNRGIFQNNIRLAHIVPSAI